jgi:hypothetical protein
MAIEYTWTIAQCEHEVATGGQAKTFRLTTYARKTIGTVCWSISQPFLGT